MNTYRVVLAMPNQDETVFRFYSEPIRAENSAADPICWLLDRLDSAYVPGGPQPECLQRINEKGEWVIC